MTSHHCQPSLAIDRQRRLANHGYRMARRDEKQLPPFARNLIKFRENAGLTQQALAEAIGIAAGSVHRYESGKGLPEREALLRLCAIFHRPVDDFFSAEPPPPKERLFGVRFKTWGTKPPGFDEELSRFLSRFGIDEAHARAEQKRAAARPKPPPPKRRTKI